VSSRNNARFAVRLAILGTAAATLGAFSGYAMLPGRTADPAKLTDALQQQVPNRTAKTDRLAGLTKVAAAEGATYSLASASSTIELEQPRAPEPMAAPPYAEPAPAAAPKSEAKVAALPAPAEKPKRLPPPPAPAASGAILDDAQIAGIRSRLRLTADQAEYWPAVEVALRDVVRTQFRDTRRHGHPKTSIDTNAPEVQKLIYAAMPLLMRLREDQKHEVRKLARVIGLESVASQI
jgi:hypothetical protein